MEKLKDQILEHIAEIDKLKYTGSWEAIGSRLIAKSEAFKTLFLVELELKKVNKNF